MNTMQRVSSEATNIRVANKCRKAHLNQHVVTLEEVLKDWFISILNYILKFQVAIKCSCKRLVVSTFFQNMSILLKLAFLST